MYLQSKSLMSGNDFTNRLTHEITANKLIIKEAKTSRFT